MSLIYNLRDLTGALYTFMGFLGLCIRAAGYKPRCFSCSSSVTSGPRFKCTVSFLPFPSYSILPLFTPSLSSPLLYSISLLLPFPLLEFSHSSSMFFIKSTTSFFHQLLFRVYMCIYTHIGVYLLAIYGPLKYLCNGMDIGSQYLCYSCIARSSCGTPNSRSWGCL